MSTEKLYFAKSTGGFYSESIHGLSRPDDSIAITEYQHEQMLAGQQAGKIIAADQHGAPMLIDAPPPSSAQVQASLTRVVQAHLDAAAQALGYDDIATAVTYADEASVAAFEAQGRALRAWRSKVWAACIVTLDAVHAGKADTPTAAALIASLPAFVAPAAS